MRDQKGMKKSKTKSDKFTEGNRGMDNLIATNLRSKKYF